MSDIQVIKESLPTRCEICHQVDLFDAATNYCARCSPVKETVAVSRNFIAKKAATLTDIEIGVASGFSLGVIIAFALSLIQTNFVIVETISIFIGLAYMGLFFGGIHGYLVGLIIGGSFRSTDGANGVLAARVLTNAVQNTRTKPGLNKLDGIISGLFIGMLIIFLPALLLAEGSLDTLYLYRIALLYWLAAGAVNGAITGFICNNRSDRKRALLLRRIKRLLLPDNRQRGV